MTNQAAQTMPSLIDRVRECHAAWAAYNAVAPGEDRAVGTEKLLTEVLAALSQTAGVPEVGRVCKWHQQDEGYDTFSTGCGHEYTVNECTDGNVQLPYCPFCAKPLRGIAWNEDDDVSLSEALSSSAAAPAASGGESAASVSERARVDALALDVANRFTQDTEPQRRASLQVAVIAAIEQALTQQRVCATCGGRGEIGGHVGQTAETFDYVTEPCPECTTPQPSADAVRDGVLAMAERFRADAAKLRESAARARKQEAAGYHFAIGSHELQQSAQDADGYADELESLLSGGSHA